MAHTLVDNINSTYRKAREAEDGPFRNHLGGSMIGRECERELYYIFRWFQRPTFEGRILRLFDRGHREEFNLVALLGSVGVAVKDRDPSTGKQWRISDVLGHFGGSLDGIATAEADIPILLHFEGRQPEDSGRVIPAGQEFLSEFKTHNTKSFSNLVNSGGVQKAKPEHYVQMQTYMLKRGLKWGLYMAVNKNDDDLHIEIVELDPEVGKAAIDKASRVINAIRVPDRIGKHPSWHACKFCDFQKICHYGETATIDRNCRTCRHSTPVAEGRWQCAKWNALIPSDVVLKGCDNHDLIRD